GALRPVDPAVLHGDLLGGMITRRQAVDERDHGVPLGIDDDDAGGIVAAAGTAQTLVRVGGEERSAVEVLLEGESDGWALRLEAARVLADPTADERAIAVEDLHFRGERVVAVVRASVGGVVVAPARESESRLDHEDLETLLVSEERDRGWKVEVFCEDLDPIAVRHDDILAAAGIVEHDFRRAVVVRPRWPRRDDDRGSRSGRRRLRLSRDDAPG